MTRVLALICGLIGVVVAFIINLLYSSKQTIEPLVQIHQSGPFMLVYPECRYLQK